MKRKTINAGAKREKKKYRPIKLQNRDNRIRKVMYLDDPMFKENPSKKMKENTLEKRIGSEELKCYK